MNEKPCREEVEALTATLIDVNQRHAEAIVERDVERALADRLAAALMRRVQRHAVEHGGTIPIQNCGFCADDVEILANHRGARS